MSSPPDERPRISLARRLLGLAVLAVTGSVFFLFLSGQVLSFEIDGRSMRPTLEPGDRVLVRAGVSGHVSPGDLVVFPDPRPEFPGDVLVKRVIAVPGDEVEIWERRLYINGVREHILGLDNLRVMDMEDQTFTVPEGHLFLLGDNRELSFDSTEFGLVAEEIVIGLVTHCYWPMDHMRRL